VISVSRARAAISLVTASAASGVGTVSHSIDDGILPPFRARR